MTETIQSEQVNSTTDGGLRDRFGNGWGSVLTQVKGRETYLGEVAIFPIEYSKA